MKSLVRSTHQAGAEGVDVLGQLLTVEGHTGLESQGVAGTESGRLDLLLGDIRCAQQRGDEHADHAGGHDDFVAVLAGVSAAEDGVGDAHGRSAGEAIALDGGQVDGDQPTGQVEGGRALQGDHGRFEGLVGDGDVGGGGVALEPGEDFLAVRGVADHEPVIGGVAGDDGVVQDSAVVAADVGVAADSVVHAVEVSGADFLEEGECVGPADLQAAHVGDVEDRAVIAGEVVLLDDAAIHERHCPSGELDHLGAELDVYFVQRRLVHVDAPRSVSNRLRPLYCPVRS